MTNMRTIAISIDEPTLAALDRLAQSARHPRSRSELVRVAIAEFLARGARAEQERREHAAIRRHRALLARQAKALVAAQAEP